MYIRVDWKDHAVERPRTYTETTNSDGTITLTPAPGSVVQQGTALSATNFNTMDEALQHIHIAYDLMESMMQAVVRAQQADIATLKTQVAAMT